MEIAAKKQLRNPDVHLPHHVLLLRLWQYPSFDSWTSFLIYVPVPRHAHTDSPIVVEVTWNHPEPETTIRQAAISEDLLDSVTSSLKQITLPLMIERSIVLDGTELGLETFGMLAAMKLSWQLGAKAWSSLTEWSNDTRTLLMRCL